MVGIVAWCSNGGISRNCMLLMRLHGSHGVVTSGRSPYGARWFAGIREGSGGRASRDVERVHIRAISSPVLRMRSPRCQPSWGRGCGGRNSGGISVKLFSGHLAGQRRSRSPGCGHFAFAFPESRAGQRDFRGVGARPPHCAFRHGRPRSGGDVQTEAFAGLASESLILLWRSRPFVLLLFGYDFLRNHARFGILDPRFPRGIELTRMLRRRKDLRTRDID